jgi:hypothetical protein
MKWRTNAVGGMEEDEALIGVPLHWHCLQVFSLVVEK